MKYKNTQFTDAITDSMCLLLFFSKEIYTFWDTRLYKYEGASENQNSHANSLIRVFGKRASSKYSIGVQCATLWGWGFFVRRKMGSLDQATFYTSCAQEPSWGTIGVWWGDNKLIFGMLETRETYLLSPFSRQTKPHLLRAICETREYDD